MFRGLRPEGSESSEAEPHNQKAGSRLTHYSEPQFFENYLGLYLYLYLYLYIYIYVYVCMYIIYIYIYVYIYIYNYPRSHLKRVEH